MNSADNTEDVAKHGRRATDNQQDEGGVPSPSSNMRSKLLSGFLALGGVTALLSSGAFINQQVVNTETINKHEQKFEQIVELIKDSNRKDSEVITEIAKITIYLQETEKRREITDSWIKKGLDGANEGLKEVKDAVQQNKEKIMIINNGRNISQDKTKVLNEGLAFANGLLFQPY